MSNKIFGASGRAMFYPFSHIPTMRTEDSLFIFFGWPQFHHKNPHKLEKSSKPGLQVCATFATLPTICDTYFKGEIRKVYRYILSVDTITCDIIEKMSLTLVVSKQNTRRVDNL